jgi:hypothetical protein
VHYGNKLLQQQAHRGKKWAIFLHPFYLSYALKNWSHQSHIQTLISLSLFSISLARTRTHTQFWSLNHLNSQQAGHVKLWEQVKHPFVWRYSYSTPMVHVTIRCLWIDHLHHLLVTCISIYRTGGHSAAGACHWCSVWKVSDKIFR